MSYLTLARRGKIAGTSNPAVASRISANLARSGRNGKAVVDVPSLNRNHKISLVDALLRLGRATSQQPSRGPLDGIWAVLRYGDYFARWSPDEFQLSSVGALIVGHQRATMSQELGIGFGVLMGERWARGTSRVAVETVDIDAVLAGAFRRLRRRRLARVGSGRPDYVLITAGHRSPTTKCVRFLECKGTSDPGRQYRQLSDAAVQLASLTVDGTVPPGLAVSTLLRNDEPLSFRAIDPESEPVEVNITERLLAQAYAPIDVYDMDGISNVSADTLAARAVRINLGSLAHFSGNGEGAGRWMPEPVGLRAGAGIDRRTIETPLGDVVGVEIRLRLIPGHEIRIFQGTDREVDEAITRGEYAAVAESQQRFAARLIEVDGNDDSGEWEASAAAPDGAFLRLTFER